MLRSGSTREFTFRPRTLPLQPTQPYESISMFLLFLALTAYYPFRRHHGEMMVLFMLGYAAHRFIDEMLRNDTDPVAFGAIVQTAKDALEATASTKRPRPRARATA